MGSDVYIPVGKLWCLRVQRLHHQTVHDINENYIHSIMEGTMQKGS